MTSQGTNKSSYRILAIKPIPCNVTVSEYIYYGTVDGLNEQINALVNVGYTSVVSCKLDY